MTLSVLMFSAMYEEGFVLELLGASVFNGGVTGWVLPPCGQGRCLDGLEARDTMQQTRHYISDYYAACTAALTTRGSPRSTKLCGWRRMAVQL